MPLQAGVRLGPYEIVAPLGAGGMGEVYKARDTRLDRTVAIKVLPPHVLDDPGLRARFEREARAASNLDHPNICVLYDVGREDSTEYLVMQYLDGGSLAERLARGPLPVDEALRYATEIASALDKAHRAGILHRDIKPGNVMLVKAAGRDASAKLLDFGLAKTVATGMPASSSSALETVTSPLTGRGTIVGTLQYMSPEQLEGGDLDPRSDIFSFGALLYEMVTGRRAFEGSSHASVIAAILQREPAPMTEVVPLTPPALDRIVRKCLNKDRDRRWQSAADLCDELSWTAQQLGSSARIAAPAASGAGKPWSSSVLVAAVLAVVSVALAAALVWTVSRRQEAVSAGIPRTLAISVPGIRLVSGGIAASPDSRTIVFVGASSEPPYQSQLYARRADSDEVTPLPGTEDARTPFFSPDGVWVGYFTSSSLMKVSLKGGAPVRMVSMPPVTRGAAWLRDDSILYTPTQASGLMRVSADGAPKPVTTVDAAQGELGHFWPALLPGGEDVLFTIRRGTAAAVDDSDIGLLHVADGSTRVLYKGGAFARYSPTGHLLFVHGGTLSAVPFDARTKTVGGSAVPVVSGIAVNAGLGGAHYDVAPDGTLFVMRGAFRATTASGVWVDLSGTATPVAGINGRPRSNPRVSPDGTRAVFDAASPDGDTEIYVTDLARGTTVRLSADPEDDFLPIWTPDGRRVIWTALPAGRLPFMVMRSADGTGPIEPVSASQQTVAEFPGSISRDGILAYTTATSNAVSDIYVMSLTGDRTPRPFARASAIEYSPEFSPDGKSIAYVSLESGAEEIYLAPYPGPGPVRRVTTGGAVSPAWSRDGRTLFYQTREGEMMAVATTQGAGISLGAPRRLFTTTFAMVSTIDSPRPYDVALDGKHFLMLKPQRSNVPPPAFHVLLNWASELKR